MKTLTYRSQTANIHPAQLIATTVTRATATSIATPNAKTTTTKIMKYQHIAPAPKPKTEFLSVGDNGQNKLPKYTPRTVPYNVDQTQSVLRRNARERNRVKQVNNSFARLRQHIPQTIITDLTKGGGRGPQKKISKVDTLRIAVEYIRRLQDLLDDLNGNAENLPNNDNSLTNTIDLHHNLDNGNMINISSSSSSSNSSSSISISTSQTSSKTDYEEQMNITNTIACQQQSQTAPQTQSPLPTILDYNTGLTNLNYNTSTSLLSPISLNSFSPPHPTQLDTTNDCQSPTSSFNSSLSFDSSTFDPLTLNKSQPASSPSPCQTDRHNTNLQLKFEPYGNFSLEDGLCTPEDDDVILGYISLWEDH